LFAAFQAIEIRGPVHDRATQERIRDLNDQVQKVEQACSFSNALGLLDYKSDDSDQESAVGGNTKSVKVNVGSLIVQRDIAFDVGSQRGDKENCRARPAR
jgi:hypothetical protein